MINNYRLLRRCSNKPILSFDVALDIDSVLTIDAMLGSNLVLTFGVVLGVNLVLTLTSYSI